MANEEVTPSKDALLNLWSSARVIAFFAVISAPYLALGRDGAFFSLLALPIALLLGMVTGYGWTFKRGSKEIWCGVAPVFGLLHPACLLCLLIDDCLIVRRRFSPPLSHSTLICALILSGFFALYLVFPMLIGIVASISLARREKQ